MPFTLAALVAPLVGVLALDDVFLMRPNGRRSSASGIASHIEGTTVARDFKCSRPFFSAAATAAARVVQVVVERVGACGADRFRAGHVGAPAGAAASSRKTITDPSALGEQEALAAWSLGAPRSPSRLDEIPFTGFWPTRGRFPRRARSLGTTPEVTIWLAAGTAAAVARGGHGAPLRHGLALPNGGRRVATDERSPVERRLSLVELLAHPGHNLPASGHGRSEHPHCKAERRLPPTRALGPELSLPD